MYKIDKDVPYEPAKRGSKRGTTKYPWPSMDVGDSVFFPYATTPDECFRLRIRLANNARTWALAAELPWKFSCREFKDGVRVWRTK